jgi:alpha-glucosidase
VFLLGGRAGDLLESDVVLALNEPCELADTAWVQPGKTTFPWWNGFAWEGADFEPGLTTETARRYIDFCSRCGIESHSLDGVGDRAWYGGPIVPYEGAKPTAGGPGLDLEAVLRHAHERGVRLRLWMHWGAAREHYKELFPLYQRLGVEGVMLDFIDRDDQLAHRFVREAVELAAKHRLTVTLHGCPKPTGLERTFPNLLSHEAALNLEYNKWEPAGCPPGHQVEVAFTRMLAGPLDFHQGSFRGVTPREFKPREVSPLVMGGPGRTLASYVVFQNHLPMVADSPPAYEGRPELRPLAQIPSTWDETRFVAGDPDNFVAIARRRGSDWFLGVMTDEREHRVELPLRFLAEGEYEGEVWADSGSPDRTLSPRRLVARAGYPLVLELPPAGGAYVRLTPR